MPLAKPRFLRALQVTRLDRFHHQLIELVGRLRVDDLPRKLLILDTLHGTCLRVQLHLEQVALQAGGADRQAAGRCRRLGWRHNAIRLPTHRRNGLRHKHQVKPLARIELPAAVPLGTVGHGRLRKIDFHELAGNPCAGLRVDEVRRGFGGKRRDPYDVGPLKAKGVEDDDVLAPLFPGDPVGNLIDARPQHGLCQPCRPVRKAGLVGPVPVLTSAHLVCHAPGMLVVQKHVVIGVADRLRRVGGVGKQEGDRGELLPRVQLIVGQAVDSRFFRRRRGPDDVIGVRQLAPEHAHVLALLLEHLEEDRACGHDQLGVGPFAVPLPHDVAGGDVRRRVVAATVAAKTGHGEGAALLLHRLQHSRKVFQGLLVRSRAPATISPLVIDQHRLSVRSLPAEGIGAAVPQDGCLVPERVDVATAPPEVRRQPGKEALHARSRQDRRQTPTQPRDIGNARRADRRP